MKIYKLYEFLELEKSYSYKIIKKGVNKNYYEFIADNDTYVVEAHTSKTSRSPLFEFFNFFTNKKLKKEMEWQPPKIDNYINFAEISWSEKKNFMNSGNSPYSDRTSKTININELFKILNTVFKIFFDFMKEKDIKYGKIGSCKKSKYKVYKQILEEEPGIRITKTNTEPWGSGRTVYNIMFEFTN